MLEKTLLRYSVALEEGDFAAVAAILTAAETDRELETMILALNDELAGELADGTLADGELADGELADGELADGELAEASRAGASLAEDRLLAAAVIQAALASNHPQRVAAVSPQEGGALTVGQVFARIRVDAARRLLRLDRADLAATQAHTSVDTPLPEDLSLRRVSRLLAELGVQVSSRFQQLFHSTAIFMRMGHNEGTVRMRATRSQPDIRVVNGLFPSVAERRAFYLAARDAAPEGAEAISPATPPAPAQTPPDKIGGIVGDVGGDGGGDVGGDIEDEAADEAATEAQVLEEPQEDGEGER
jgi:hypothetical protein